MLSSIGALFLLLGVGMARSARTACATISRRHAGRLRDRRALPAIHGLRLIIVRGIPEDWRVAPRTWGGRLLVTRHRDLLPAASTLALSGVRLAGAQITIGGVCFLAGWGTLARAWWPSRWRRVFALAPRGHAGRRRRRDASSCWDGVIASLEPRRAAPVTDELGDTARCCRRRGRPRARERPRPHGWKGSTATAAAAG